METIVKEKEKTKVENEIVHFEKKVRLFRDGKIDADKFRATRLLRGIYGQRQPGVQMARIKIPFGKLSVKQLIHLADLSDEFSNGNLHLTTRQDVQIYFVSLDKTAELWRRLESEGITLREACGNTVRNITASSIAGIDPKEPFDVTPYAEALFRFFLRNPIQENLGRKIKIAFSSSDDDTAYTFIHDLGFIPKVKIEDGKIVRGFKVMIAGGLGAQPMLAQVAKDFLPHDQLILFSEAVIRVFDRYGERNNRHKARLKYLIAKAGLEEFLRLVEEENLAVKSTELKLENESAKEFYRGEGLKKNDEKISVFTTLKVSDDEKYKQWLETNVFEQKQQGFFAVGVRVPLGNIGSEKVRQFAEVLKKYAAEELRITINQGFLLRFVPKEALPALYRELDVLGLALPGFDSTGDITACPGTDTCNLGISNSTGIALELEKVIQNEYSDLLYEKNIRIKISGCMNSCGQHSLAHIGFHGSSLKAGTQILPALQVLLGGGMAGNGQGRISDKVIKIPSKRGPAVLREILDDYEKNSLENETFNAYYDRSGNNYFFQLLKQYSDLSAVSADEFKDWGYEENYKPSVGVGECAGVVIDLVATLLFEAEEKVQWSAIALDENLFGDSLYHSYSVFIQGAKTLLLIKRVHTNTQHSVIAEFEKKFVSTGEFPLEKSFSEIVLQINKNKPDREFAERYYAEAKNFLEKVNLHRAALLQQGYAEEITN